MEKLKCSNIFNLLILNNNHKLKQELQEK